MERNKDGVVSPTGFPHSFLQNVNKGGEKWGKVVQFSYFDEKRRDFLTQLFH